MTTIRIRVETEPGRAVVSCNLKCLPSELQQQVSENIGLEKDFYGSISKEFTGNSSYLVKQDTINFAKAIDWSLRKNGLSFVKPDGPLYDGFLELVATYHNGAAYVAKYEYNAEKAGQDKVSGTSTVKQESPLSDGIQKIAATDKNGSSSVAKDGYYAEMAVRKKKYSTTSNLGSAAYHHLVGFEGASTELLDYINVAMHPQDLVEYEYDPDLVFTELTQRVEDASFGSYDHAHCFIQHWLIWAGRELAHFEAPPQNILKSAQIIIESDPNNIRGQSYGTLFLNIYFGECIRGRNIDKDVSWQKRADLAALVGYQGVKS